MQKALTIFLAIIWSYLAGAQMNYGSLSDTRLIPVINTIPHRLGNDNINIQVFQYGDKNDIVFINLHDNEVSSVDGAKKILENHGGLLIKIENKNKRNVSFRLDDRSYTFDPNRIFSKIGIKLTLKRFGNISNQAEREIEGFASKLLQIISPDIHCVIAVHNNTNNGFSIGDYLPGKEKASDARQIKIADGQDPDDFFLTTDSLLFQLLSAKNYNTILQDNLKALHDGSLSVYCGERNIRYINCETEQGKIKQHEEMLETAIECIKNLKKMTVSTQ